MLWDNCALCFDNERVWLVGTIVDISRERRQQTLLAYNDTGKLSTYCKSCYVHSNLQFRNIEISIHFNFAFSPFPTVLLVCTIPVMGKLNFHWYLILHCNFILLVKLVKISCMRKITWFTVCSHKVHAFTVTCKVWHLSAQRQCQADNSIINSITSIVRLAWSRSQHVG